MITISIHDSENPGKNEIFEGELLAFAMTSKTEKAGGYNNSVEIIGEGGHGSLVASLTAVASAYAEGLKDCQSCRLVAARKIQEILVPEAAAFAKKMMADMFGGKRNEN